MGLSSFKTGISVTAMIVACLAGFSTASAQTETGADAQTATNNRGQLDEIIVTARRSEESLKDTPLAVGVMGEDFLREQKIDSVDDIMALSPGASFVAFSKVQPELAMRGFVAPTPGNASSEQSILMVVDGMVLSKDFMKSPPIFDMNRIEVLRGPQGTTFGRNASIGLVHLITNKPTFEFEAGATVTAGSDELIEADTYVSGPLSNTLAARLAVHFDSNEGPTRSISTGEGLDGKSNFAVRGSLLFEPSDSVRANLKLEYSKDNDDGAVRRGRDCTTPFIDGPRITGPFTGIFVNHPPFATTFTDSCDVFKTEISSDTEFFADREIFTATAEIAVEIADGITATSVTGYQDGTGDGLADVFGSPENIVFQEIHNDGYLFSEELRIDNHASGAPLRWLVGGYYLHDQEDRFEENQFFANNALPAPRVSSFLATISSNKTDSVAAFGEVIYAVNDKLEIAAGGRWTKDYKDYVYSVRASGFRPVIAGVTGCNPPGIICGSRASPVGFAPVPVSDSWADFTGKLSVQYKINNDHTLYALWSQGFKSGGFQPDARTAEEASVPFNPERSNNYEIGWKGEINRTARFTLTSFYMKSNGTQTTTLIPLSQGFTAIVVNVGSTRSFGVEGDFTWLVSDSFRMGGTFALIDAALKNTILTTGVDALGNPVLEDLSGQRPEIAPRWTATYYAEYDINFGDGSLLSLRGDFTGRDNMFDDNTERALRTRIRPTLTNFGARATYKFGNDLNYRASLWIKNINEDYDINNTGPRTPNALQLPEGFSGKRQYGLTLSADF